MDCVWQEKRQKKFQNLKKLNSIIYLQETHCTNEDENIWKIDWEVDIFFSNGTSNSSGVAILFPKCMNLEICEKNTDLEGRIILIKIKSNDKFFVLYNVYAPTQEHKQDQNSFAIKLKNVLAPFMNENILLGGDFNFYLNPKLDKLDIMSNKNDNMVYRNEIQALLESMGLTDCFRNLYPNLRRYTWHARGKSSRLDYRFISEHILNDLTSYKIEPGLHSDHSILKIQIGSNNLARGRGFWKFDTSLLHDITYVNEIKNIIYSTILCKK